MKFIKITVFILMLSVTFAYADDNMTISSDNSTNKTSKSSKKIPAKLVPDRKINDKNQFMRDFGFPAREELKNMYAHKNRDVLGSAGHALD